jgi:hypothetical protein
MRRFSSGANIAGRPKMQASGSSTGCDMKSGMSIRQLYLRSVVSEVLHAAVWCALLVGVAYGQASQDQVDEILKGINHAADFGAYKVPISLALVS